MRVVQVPEHPAVTLAKVASAAGLRSMLADLRQHGAYGRRMRVARVVALPEGHPDRYAGCGEPVEFTHYAVIRYRPSNRPGVWECVYGITTTGDTCLFSD